MKQPRKKKCVICKSSFIPTFSTLQKTCSITCAITHGKIKEAEKQNSLNEIRNEKTHIDKLSKIIEQTKKIVHEYIRERDKGKPCISCGGSYKSDFDAGHFFPGGKFNALRFDLNNINGQCIQCNRRKEGEFEMYSLSLPKRIGDEAYQKLVKRAEIAKIVTHTWTRTELKEIQKTVKNLKKKL